jgi:hypothetical protein
MRTAPVARTGAERLGVARQRSGWRSAALTVSGWLVGAADHKTAGVTRIEFRAAVDRRRSVVVTPRRMVDRRVWSFRRMQTAASWTEMSAKSC